MMNRRASSTYNNLGVKKISQKHRISTRTLKILIIIILSTIVLITTAFIADAAINRNKIHYGVSISGVNLGLKTKTEAKEIISKKLEDSYDQNLNLKYKNKSWQLELDEIDTQINIDKSVNNAFKVSREGSIFKQIKIRFSSWVNPVKTSLIYSVDSKKLQKFVSVICQEIDEKPIDARINIEGQDAWVVEGKVGIEVERPKLYAEIRKNIPSFNRDNIVIPIKLLPARVTKEDAEEALKDVKIMISDSVELRYDKYRWTMTPEEISHLIAFKFIKKIDEKKDKTIKRYKAVLNREKLGDYLKRKATEIYIPAEDADFIIEATKVKISPSQNGREVDTGEAFPRLNKAVLSEPPRDVILTTRVVEPELTTEEARAMDIRELVASYTTKYNSGNTPRVHNIHLLADKIDGTIIAPGEIFSFNQVVGPRTRDAGFVEAPAIIQGDYLSAVGGGVCQVATTLFNTVFFGGYEVVDRHNHSLYISHYPNGRDAGVSYPSPDFKFRNDTNAYMLLKTWYSSSSITISFYSQDLGTEISYETTPFTNIKPYDFKRVDDKELEKGKEELESRGLEGKDITVYRTVRRNGKIVHKDVFFSRYRPKTEVIRVGTKEPPPPPPDKKETTPEVENNTETTTATTIEN